MERLAVINSARIVSIDVSSNSTQTETSDLTELAFALSSAYLDNVVQMTSNNEVVKCQLIDSISIDGKPTVSNW